MLLLSLLSCQTDRYLVGTDRCPVSASPEQTESDFFIFYESGGTCDDPYYHALYVGAVEWVEGNTVGLRFWKDEGTPAETNFYYWIFVGEPACEPDGEYLDQVRMWGIWPAGEAELSVEVPIWPTEEAYEAAPSGEIMSLHLMTGGNGTAESENQIRPIWYQPEAFRFEKECEEAWVE